ncbi:hypothetical protein HDV00_006773 [Rhizophlyctis rosea]|nr:hypothetical protein HDV00_006773 [Rhizophlyctis rosea]
MAAGPRSKVCIVGSGPAGFYAADRLLKASDNIDIDMLEALPVPYGLVRYGVAPDHPEVKNVIHKFETVAQESRFRYLGNVRVGQDISITELRPRFNAILLACGASQDRRLGLANEESIPNVFSARAFVGWYNGLPEHKDLNPDLTSSDTAIVVGHGNVALDVARILLCPIEELAKTDITEHALEKLRNNKIRHVHLVGRRGPLQVSFTAKEVREMMALPDTRFSINVPLLESQIKAGDAILKKDRARRRLMDLLHKNALSPKTGASKSWSLQFLATPSALLTNGLKLEGLQFMKNTLTGPPESPRAEMTTEMGELKGGLLLRSIGYQIVAPEGIPFDSRKGVVPNDRGRVLAEGERVPGLYVAGWLKRGPTGVIAATMYDAVETADVILEDVKNKQLPLKKLDDAAPLADVEDLLKARGVQTVSFADWMRIDAQEEKEGGERGKPREKMVDVGRCLNMRSKFRVG